MKSQFVMKLTSDSKVRFSDSKSADMCADILKKDLSDDVYRRHAAVIQEFTPDR